MLSKSKYCKYLQCPKLLWLDKYKPSAMTPDPSRDSRFEAGNIIGDMAMQLFGDFVEVTAYKADGSLDLKKMIEDTTTLIQSGEENICEASFSFNGCYCAVDILRKTNDGYAIYEVKSSTHEKDIYINDVAYQQYVLENCGIKVTGAYLVLINNQYIRSGDIDIQQLFKVVDISNKVAAQMSIVETNTTAANKVLADPNTEPPCDLSHGCQDPYSCAFWDYCTAQLPKPSVFDLYTLTFAKKLDFYESGSITYAQLKDNKDVMKNKIRSLQVTHQLSSLGTHIDKDGIRSFLSKLSYPLYFLDFETMMPAIPMFDNSKPYQQIPFQYSLHYIINEGGNVMHKEFLGDSCNDPRRALAEQLCRDIPKDVCVLAYNKNFECSRIKEMAESFPDLADHLNNIKDNIKDLIDPFRAGHYYNRQMGGSLSIKSVLPAVFPNDPSLNYHNLVGVHNGSEAMTIYPKIKDMPPEEQAAVRTALLKYCELDTFAMVKLWQALTDASK